MLSMILIHMIINNVLRGTALRLCQICETDEKFESWANEYKQ